MAAADVSLLNPVVTANAAGQGILAGNVVGRGTNLTLAYAPVTLTSHGARAGAGMQGVFCAHHYNLRMRCTQAPCSL